MNKPKAMADRTPREFADHIESVLDAMMRLSTTTDAERGLTLAFIQVMREELEKPAPNPFTKDQLAWMREEQRAGLRYAAMDENGNVYMYAACPHKRENEWWYNSYTGWQCRNFLQSVLSWEDDKPLCFADYAPLPEGAPKEADHVQED